MSKESFSARLKSTRESLGMTRAEAAAALEISASHYHAIESKGTCNLATAVRIADALSVSLDYLTGRTDSDIDTQQREALIEEQRQEAIRKQIAELQAQLQAPAA